jgi:hypothetical protein
MLVLALLLGFIGPFDTYSSLMLAPRLGYWLLVVFTTYGVGTFFSRLALAALERWLNNTALSVLVIGLSASVPVAAVVTLINVLVMGTQPDATANALLFWGYCFAIACCIGALHSIFAPAAKLDRQLPSTAPPAEPSPEGRGTAQGDPAILARLPVAVRGGLSHLSMQDHYVEVVTERGRALVLLRLSDAMQETRPVAGLQIHRSHWVALARVRHVRREQGKVMVEMANGDRLPVSRGFLAAAREAGLLV